VLLLVFRLGIDRYALDASQILEVLPLVEMRPAPQAPPGIAGVFDLRGRMVPVIDLSALVFGWPAGRCLSTRVIIAGYKDPAGEIRPLGLIAERATDTVARRLSDFVDSGMAHDGAPYLGPVARDAEGLLQLIDVDRLLPDPVRDALFKPRENDRWPLPTSKAC
jgi:chemotaxis-related protein WspB